jgi:hypothetical protein
VPIRILGRLTETPAIYLSIQDQDVTRSHGAKLRRGEQGWTWKNTYVLNQTTVRQTWVPHGRTECRTEERFLSARRYDEYRTEERFAKDLSRYLGRETPKDLETEKEFAKKIPRQRNDVQTKISNKRVSKSKCRVKRGGCVSKIVHNRNYDDLIMS